MVNTVIDMVNDRYEDTVIYFRNTLTDPSSRGTTATQSFSGNASNKVFTLTNTGVQNVIAVTVASVSQLNRLDYVVAYGEGTSATTVTFYTAPPLGTNNVVIQYHYGQSMVVKEVARDDSQLPRVIIMSGPINMEERGVGKPFEDGKGVFIHASYIIEVRSQYAKQARDIINQAFNQAQILDTMSPRLYRLIYAHTVDVTNLDYLQDRRAYVWRFVLRIRWSHKYVVT